MKIFNESTLNKCNFKITKPFNYCNKIIFDLYSDKDELIYIESPSFILPMIYILNEITQKLSITLYEYKSNQFGKKISLMINKIINCAKIYYENLFYQKTFKNPIVLNKNTSVFQFNNIRLDDTEIYNKYKEQITIKNLDIDDRITIIFHLKNIWISNNKYGINFNLVQLRRDNYFEKGYLFLNNEHIDKIKPKIEEKKINKTNDNNKREENIIKRPVFNLDELLSVRQSILNK